MKSYKKALALCVLFLGLAGLAYAVTPWWRYYTELNYQPPTRAEWFAANPNTVTAYVSDNSPYVWNGQRMGGVHAVVYDTTTTARTVAPWETGTVFSNTTASSDDRLDFNLPAAKKGMEFSFIKGDSVSASVLWLQANTGDTINAGTASKAYKCTGTTQPQAAGIVCTEDGKWRVLYQVGTWANDNS